MSEPSPLPDHFGMAAHFAFDIAVAVGAVLGPWWSAVLEPLAHVWLLIGAVVVITLRAKGVSEANRRARRDDPP